MSAVAFKPTGKTKIRRLAKRAVWDRETVFGVLDAGLACHVGYVVDGQPYVTPTAYARIGERVVWHGSSASRMLRRLAEGVPVCFTVSLLDGIVHARSGFHSSFNYRSVMAFGTAEEILDKDEKAAALEAIVERITPGRWADLRPMTGQELKATKVLSLRLEEVACKIRDGGPSDDEADYDLPIWAGEVPIRLVAGEPLDDARLKPGIPRPAYLKDTRLG
ncbi:hypothetical protein SAMN06265365_13625 [Tistlia consotensis]|uniref:Nitroimidazol reductase NimA, pyridoxamine 5'-phosphate oxidase superfamily n=1 Tax=Tistlia consotensis USBA 355 TaxID=560819 RepID=A0A1Y6CMR8_9PROT|nr:pyridoxamine 5'-phosphate oxidase family protein [Tistlia consotensis]SMF78260.1 hypothetical protein SAMN05428998_13826 [Tistlia consotensis USBA 355]SNS18162.1 hypothetical protein SAMN06265365_13625 [Tistlia consotensis]